MSQARTARRWPRTLALLGVVTLLDLGSPEAASAQQREFSPVLTKRVSALTTTEPENAARLIRLWIGEDHR